LFRTFVRLMESGSADEFYTHAARYEQFLLENNLKVEYYKIKTNEGFYDASHGLPFRAMETAQQLEEVIRESKDDAYHYLVTGLRGDIYKSMHLPDADSLYQMALAEVGDRDQKFAMLTHVSLAQVNYLTDPEKSVEWAHRGLSEAERLNSMEHRSMSLGILAFVYFMTGDEDEFKMTVLEYQRVKDEFKDMVARGKQGYQVLDTRYDVVIEIAKLAFDGQFDEALKMADASTNLNVDRQLVVYRLHSMEGTFEKEQSMKMLTRWFIGLTLIYIFIYIMGRRRLLKTIWKRNEEIRVALEKADAANRIKTSFIRSMSHEIRTPLNAINGFSQIICNPKYELNDDEKQDMRERIASSSEAITIIINELLELAAGESVKLDLNELTPINVNKVCRKAVEAAQTCNEKGLQISFTSELGDDYSIRSNEETVLQILDKVINNAQKFTNEGCILVHAAKQDNTIAISVTDTGIGIAEDKMDAVFDNFVKLDEFTDGIGLGLSISLRLAKSLGGKLTIDRTYKTGSRFILQLPVIQ